MIISRSIFVAANGTVSFFLMSGERSIVYLCQAGIHGDTGRGAPKESVTGRDLRAQQRHVGSGGQPRGALSRSGQLPGTEAGSRGGCRVTRIAQVMRMCWTQAQGFLGVDTAKVACSFPLMLTVCLGIETWTQTTHGNIALFAPKHQFTD